MGRLSIVCEADGTWLEFCIEEQVLRIVGAFMLGDRLNFSPASRGLNFFRVCLRKSFCPRIQVTTTFAYDLCCTAGEVAVTP